MSPDGLVLRAREELREPVPGRGGTARVVWRLPADSGQNQGRVSVRLQIDGGRTPVEPGSVAIGEIANNRFSSSVPVLSLDGSAAVADAWKAVRKGLSEFGCVVGRSSRGETFHRRLVEAEFKGIGRLHGDTAPRQAVTCAETAVERLAAFAEAHGADKRILDEIQRVLEKAAECRKTAGGLTALEHALKGLAAKASAEMQGTRGMAPRGIGGAAG